MIKNHHSNDFFRKKKNKLTFENKYESG